MLQESKLLKYATRSDVSVLKTSSDLIRPLLWNFISSFDFIWTWTPKGSKCKLKGSMELLWFV